MRIAALAALLVGLAAGCGGGSSTPKGWLRPTKPYEAAGCAGASKQRGPQYVVVTAWKNGKATGNSGNFTGVPKCGDVIVYAESGKRDELRIPALRIETAVVPGKTAKLEFYAPGGTYPVVLSAQKRELVRVVVAR